jgi:uncharacterized membrane protein YbhN (UPF0104 family)
VRWFSFLQSPVGIVLRYALTLGLLGWLATRVDWTALTGLRALDWRLAAPAVLLAGLAYPLQIGRWQVLLRAQGFAVPAGRAHAASWAGFFYNSFLPGGIAGDAVRFNLLWQQAPGRKTAAATGLLADRLVGLAALFALASLALGLHLAQHEANREERLLLLVSAGGLALLLLGAGLLPLTKVWEPLAVRLLGAARTKSLLEAVQPLTDARVAGLCLLLSFAVWLADFAALWLLARSLGLEPGFWGLSAASAGAYVVASLPVSIGGHGLREGTLVALLHVLGLGSGQEALVALLAMAFFALSVGWSLIGGVVVLFTPKHPARVA